MYINDLIKNNMDIEGPVSDLPWGIPLIGLINDLCDEHMVLKMDATMADVHEHISKLPERSRVELLSKPIEEDDVLTGLLYQEYYNVHNEPTWTTPRLILITIVPFLVGFLISTLVYIGEEKIVDVIKVLLTP